MYYFLPDDNGRVNALFKPKDGKPIEGYYSTDTIPPTPPTDEGYTSILYYADGVLAWKTIEQAIADSDIEVFTPAEPSELRRQAYETEVDPLVTRYISYHAEAEYAEEMADVNEEASDAYLAQRNTFRDIADNLLVEIAKKKAEIRVRYPNEVTK